MLDYNLRTLTRKQKGVKGEYLSVFLRLSYNGERRDISLNISVPTQCYDNQKCKIVKHAEAKQLNEKIEKTSQLINEIFGKFEYVIKQTPTLQMVVNELDKSRGKHKVNTETVFDYIDIFVKQQIAERGWAKSTTNMFNTLKRNLKLYAEEKNVSIKFSTIDDTLLQNFCIWLNTDLKQQNVSVMKMARCARWFLRWAVKKGYYIGTSHDTFRPQLRGGHGEYKTIIYLTEEEINKLREFKGAPYLERVRDVFLFACFCGLRYSDVAALRKEQVSDEYIKVVTQKTNATVYIDLNKHTKAILDKYKDYDDGHNHALPVPSNQKTNDYIKEICKACKIDEPVELICYVGSERKSVILPKHEVVTFHASRRTFITHALRLGIPVPVIMKFTGHKSVNMLKPYMKIVDELKAREMSKFDMM